MRYLIGTIASLLATRAAIDVLGGCPKPSAMPSPPRPAEYYEGALGWTGHVLTPPQFVENVDDVPHGYLQLPESEELDGYLGQGDIPPASELLSREELPQSYQDKITSLEQIG